jgi:hypothetical protein
MVFMVVGMLRGTISRTDSSRTLFVLWLLVLVSAALVHIAITPLTIGAPEYFQANGNSEILEDDSAMVGPSRPGNFLLLEAAAGSAMEANTTYSDDSVSNKMTALTYTQAVDTVGIGMVVVDSDQTEYYEGQLELSTAEPAESSTFDIWSGALAGSVNPTILIMDGD